MGAGSSGIGEQFPVHRVDHTSSVPDPSAIHGGQVNRVAVLTIRAEGVDRGVFTGIHLDIDRVDIPASSLDLVNDGVGPYPSIVGTEFPVNGVDNAGP